VTVSDGQAASAGKTAATAGTAMPMAGPTWPPTLTIGTKGSQQVKQGQTFQVYGSLQDGYTSMGAGWTVDVYKKALSNGAWVKVSVKTNAAGYYYANLALLGTGDYQVWAEFHGGPDTFWAPCTSGKMLMQSYTVGTTPPAKKPTSASFWVSSQRVQPNTFFGIQGTVNTGGISLTGPVKIYVMTKAHISDPWGPKTLLTTSATPFTRTAKIPYLTYAAFWIEYSGSTSYLPSVSNTVYMVSTAG